MEVGCVADVSKVTFYPADAEYVGGILFKNVGIKADFTRCQQQAGKR